MHFEGDFMPQSVVSRVARCVVSAIGGDGMFRYHVGLAFNKPIDLDEAPEAGETEPEAPQAAAVPAALPSPEPSRPVVQNRW